MREKGFVIVDFRKISHSQLKKQGFNAFLITWENVHDIMLPIKRLYNYDMILLLRRKKLCFLINIGKNYQ